MYFKNRTRYLKLHKLWIQALKYFIRKMSKSKIKASEKQNIFVVISFCEQLLKNFYLFLDYLLYLYCGIRELLVC